jgi:hypothetical protein
MPADDGKNEAPKKRSQKKGRTKPKTKTKAGGTKNKNQTINPVKNVLNCWYFFSIN